VVTDKEGKERLTVTDSKWKFTSDATTQGEIYDGETYDARLEKDWSLVAVCQKTNYSN
jgi:alpha-L-rhamnosidase